MIRKTLSHTQMATYSIELPDINQEGLPIPKGTGFFISPDGWFVTAAHVITKNNRSDGPVRKDLNKGWLSKESRHGQFSSGECREIEFEYIDPENDFALLKLDFAKNSQRDHLKDRSGFPYIEVSKRMLEEGEPVYSFGYPLSSAGLLIDMPEIKVGYYAHSPRTTSAIVSSTLVQSEMVSFADMPIEYVLDKALNYGNSGGPIVATDTGKVHALCSRFQPVFIPQPHLIGIPTQTLGLLMVGIRLSEEAILPQPYHQDIPIMIPSLYGIVRGLNSKCILHELESRGIPISDK